MEGSGPAPNGQSSAAPPAQSALIRPEQVKKLPHLDNETKARQEVGIQKLWDIIHSRPANSPEQQQAYARLSQISATLMNGMRQFQSKKKQEAAAQQQNGANTTSHATNNTTTFDQLNPAIQARVNATQFIYPPAMTEGQPNADNWLREAKARFGQALQRSEMAKSRRQELQRSLQARQHAGVATPEDINAFNQKIQQCQKAIAESDNFMTKFREQQQSFRQQQVQQRFANQGQIGLSESGDQPMLSNMPGNQPPQGPQGPTPHSISSAVSAARNQASAAPSATSPPAEQAQATQGQNAINGTPVSQNHPSNTNPSPYNIPQSQIDIPGSATSQHPGPPRSLSHQALSHQAAMSQSAQSHAALQNQQQAQSSGHAHPPTSYLNSTKKDDRLPISKNLQVTTPAPVPVPAARPTLNGGPGVGMPGQMGQPAIPSMPGYVLETSEDGRVLSKKKLHELVREVCGPGGDEQLTPEVEEIFLQIADDFVDDLITAACRLAKLRGSTTLDIRDIQLVLERQYNIRVPGFSSDEVRTVRRSQPAAGWAQKMSAVQAAKLTGGGNASAGTGTANGVKDT